MKSVDEGSLSHVVMGHYADKTMVKQCMSCGGGSNCACGCKSTHGVGSRAIPYTNEIWD